MGSMPLRALLVIMTLVLVLTVAGGAALADRSDKEEEPMAEMSATGKPVVVSDEPRKPTNISLSLEEIEQGTARASAKLTEQAGQPVKGAKVTFFRKTTFGQLELETVSSDGKGIASISLPVYPGQEVDVRAAFAGDQKLEPAEAITSLSLPPAAAPPQSSMLTKRPSPRWIFILLLLIGGVWTTYAYVFSLLARIKRAGATGMATSASGP